MLGKGFVSDENLRRNQDHRKYSFVKISYITEKSPRDLKWLTVTQNTMKDHQTWGNKPESNGERTKVKKISKKDKTIQAKQGFPKQGKKILPTTGRWWHKHTNKMQVKPKNFGQKHSNHKTWQKSQMDKQYDRSIRKTRRRPESVNTDWFTQNGIKKILNY